MLLFIPYQAIQALGSPMSGKHLGSPLHCAVISRWTNARMPIFYHRLRPRPENKNKNEYYAWQGRRKGVKWARQQRGPPGGMQGCSASRDAHRGLRHIQESSNGRRDSRKSAARLPRHRKGSDPPGRKHRHRRCFQSLHQGEGEGLPAGWVIHLRISSYGL